MLGRPDDSPSARDLRLRATEGIIKVFEELGMKPPDEFFVLLLGLSAVAEQLQMPRDVLQLAVKEQYQRTIAFTSEMATKQ